MCENKKTIKIYIRVDTDIAYMRMNSRVRHDSRIEKMKNPDKRIAELKRLEKMFDRVVPNITVYA